MTTNFKKISQNEMTKIVGGLLIEYTTYNPGGKYSSELTDKEKVEIEVKQSKTNTK